MSVVFYHSANHGLGVFIVKNIDDKVNFILVHSVSKRDLVLTLQPEG